MIRKGLIAVGIVGFLGMSFLTAQTPGEIIAPSTPFISPLNIDGNSWTTTCNCAYSSDDQTESEILWTAIPQVESEVSGDLSTGGGCGTTDVMDDPTSGADATYVYFSDPDGIPDNGDEFMMYRMRIAKDPGNGNFGFSVLMDIDGQFGVGDDANAVAGNPGFEIEIRVKNGSGSKGLYLDDVDGVTSGTSMQSYDLGIYTQRSYAMATTASCTSKDPVFYDFFLPFSDLTTYFGVTSSTGIRIVGATSISGSSSLSNGKSDIAGVDDSKYANSVAGTDAAYTALVNSYNPVTATQAGGGGVLPVELVSYDAQKSSNQVNLSWMTASEQDVDYFIIQHADDNHGFRNIGQVDAAGNSDQLMYYQFEFKEVTIGNNYFKLVESTVNGEENDLGLLNVVYSSSDVNPYTFNQSNHEITFGSFETNIPFYIYNMGGQLVQVGDVFQQRVTLNHLEKGIYMLQIGENNYRLMIQ